MILPPDFPGPRFQGHVWLINASNRSYALYLWHYPVFFVAGVLWWRTAPGWLDLPKADLLTVVAAWAIAFTLAAASFRYIEAPALRWKATLSARNIAVTCSSTCGLPS